MDTLLSVVLVVSAVALCAGCLLLARRLGPTRGGAPDGTSAQRDRERTAGYEAVDRKRQMGGPPGF